MSKEIKNLLAIFNNPELTSKELEHYALKIVAQLKEQEHYALKIVALLNASREKAKS